LGSGNYTVPCGGSGDLFFDKQGCDKTVMLSQKNLQQDQDQSEHKDHRKNMSFHRGALVSKVKRTFTSVNTSLVVFCNQKDLGTLNAVLVNFYRQKGDFRNSLNQKNERCPATKILSFYSVYQ